MRLLIVCSGNAPQFDVKRHQAFVYEQVEAVKELDKTLELDYFFITGKGVTGYLLCLKALTVQLKQHKYDGIHAHVATSALLANLQRRVPVVTTFHGSDINVPGIRILSLFVGILSKKTIYITHRLAEKAIYADQNKLAIIPCGVNLMLFKPACKSKSRQQLGLSLDKKYILFSSGFDNPVKNYPLARSAVNLLADDTITLIELKNYTRQEVALLFTAVDVALMTSFSEGSPQFVKEALACNCPVVSTDVGDVRFVLKNIAGCYVSSYEPEDVAHKLRQALALTTPIDARQHIQRFDNRVIAQQIHSIYQQICTP